MRTDEFIKQCVYGNQIKEKRVANIYFDGKNIYSYGEHYPLLININDKWVLNDRGYSATTGRHIFYAKPFADYRVNLNPNASDDLMQAVKLSAKEEVKKLKKSLKSLPSRAFRQKQIKTDRLAEITKTLEFVKNVKITPTPPKTDMLKTTTAIAQLGNIFGNTQTEKNDWKARMLKAGLENRGLIMPSNWNELTEDEKEKRLNAVINEIS